jgi:S-DNA-T family DNA segregation ATPase FtsK/SpoIIIE
MAMDDIDATVMWKPDPLAKLAVQKGPQAGMSFPLSEGEVLVGRADDLDIVLQDPMTSRRHARISSHMGQFIIEDRADHWSPRA